MPPRAVSLEREFLGGELLGRGFFEGDLLGKEFYGLDYPLYSAVYGGHKETVELLFDEGVDVNAQYGEYGTALMIASYRGHKEIVELLLNKGADVNIRGGRLRTALLAAAHEGHKEVVALLLNEVPMSMLKLDSATRRCTRRHMETISGWSSRSLKRVLGPGHPETTTRCKQSSSRLSEGN